MEEPKSQSREVESGKPRKRSSIDGFAPERVREALSNEEVEALFEREREALAVAMHEAREPAPALSGSWAEQKAEQLMRLKRREALQRCFEVVSEPIVVPECFVQIDRLLKAAWEKTLLGEAARDIHWQRSGLAQSKDDPGPDPTGVREICGCLEYLWYTESVRRLQGKREELLPEFLAEARFWDEEKIRKEIKSREYERTHRLDTTRLRLFTVGELFIVDPFIRVGVFATKTIAQLYLLLDGAPREASDAAIEALVAAVVADIKVETLLQTKCEELKRNSPPGLHELIDRGFRRAIEQRREEM